MDIDYSEFKMEFNYTKAYSEIFDAFCKKVNILSDSELTAEEIHVKILAFIQKERMEDSYSEIDKLKQDIIQIRDSIEKVKEFDAIRKKSLIREIKKHFNYQDSELEQFSLQKLEIIAKLPEEFERVNCKKKIHDNQRYNKFLVPTKNLDNVREEKEDILIKNNARYNKYLVPIGNQING